MAQKHSHYFKDVSHLSTVDVYRVIALFGVTDPCVQHAVKKLLVAGGRGAGKDISRDIQEAIDSLEQWKEMQAEDGPQLRLVPARDPDLQDMPSAEALMNDVDPVDTAYRWFDRARSQVTEPWAFKAIVRLLLKALENKIAPIDAPPSPPPEVGAAIREECFQ